MHTKIIHLTTAKLGRQLPLVLYLPTHVTFVTVILVRTHAEGISLYSLCTRCANELVLANRGNRRFPHVANLSFGEDAYGRANDYNA